MVNDSQSELDKALLQLKQHFNKDYNMADKSKRKDDKKDMKKKKDKK